MKITRQELKTEADLFVLKDVWSRLEQGEEMTSFQTYEWHRLLLKEWTGWKLHAIYSRCFVYVAWDGDAAVMLLPIIEYKFSTRTKWFGSKKGIYLLGHGSYSDYLNAVFDTFREDAFSSILDALRKDFPGKRLCLTSVREDSSLAAYLLAKGAACEEFTVAVSLKMKESPEAYQASLSKKTRANLRKAVNRINRDGIDYEIEVLGRIEDQALLDEMVKIHVKRILVKNTKHDGILHMLSAEIRKAYRKYRDLHNNIIAMSMAENENSRIVLIKMNGQLAGYEYCLREAQCYRLVQTCFDEKYKFYSPMFKGIFDFIMQCHEDRSLREIDFTRGDEEYKRSLGGEETRLYQFTL